MITALVEVGAFRSCMIAGSVENHAAIMQVLNACGAL